MLSLSVHARQARTADGAMAPERIEIGDDELPSLERTDPLRVAQPQLSAENTFMHSSDVPPRGANTKSRLSEHDAVGSDFYDAPLMEYCSTRRLGRPRIG
jgi:hypothetical protein